LHHFNAIPARRSSDLTNQERHYLSVLKTYLLTSLKFGYVKSYSLLAIISKNHNNSYQLSGQIKKVRTLIPDKHPFVENQSYFPVFNVGLKDKINKNAIPMEPPIASNLAAIGSLSKKV